MNNPGQWLIDLGHADSAAPEGLVSVEGYFTDGRPPDGAPPEEVAIMEKAQYYGASAVFFEAGKNGGPPLAQAFIFVSDGSEPEKKFAELHRRLWSWGGVPLVYRKLPGLVQLFRCAHEPDFESKGKIVFKPYKTFRFASRIANDPWWDAERLRSGALWDDPKVCKQLLAANKAAQKTLIGEVKRLHRKLHEEFGKEEKEPLAGLFQQLLILSLLIAYLEARKVFEDGYFTHFLDGAEESFQVLGDGPALVRLLDDLDRRFNGHAFRLTEDDRATLQDNEQAERIAWFAELIEGRQEPSGQRTLWRRYSFADLPVELISHIYQLFVDDKKTAVYTPPFLVRLILAEVLDWERLDRLESRNEIILDPSCGSGIFLVEAYKRLVLHWRSRNGWKHPGVDEIPVLKELLTRVHGIDLEERAVELAAFSLYLALCDALEPEAIRASVKLFPELKGKSLHAGCFFEACEAGKIKEKIGIVVGNPPFDSSWGTPAAERTGERYRKKHGAPIPDKQRAYLFLHESMATLAGGGVLALLQPHGFLYNQNSLDFRRRFMKHRDMREILDFISVRGLFQKGGADTKVVVVVAEANEPPPDRQILHATFRRSGRADAEQGFDIDYYDMHWLPRELALTNDGVWRADLLGGGRILGFVDRLKKFSTLGEYAKERGWDCGEGFNEGARGVSRPAEHIIGKPLLPTKAITENGIDESAITIAMKKPIEGPRSEKRFTPPMLLVREQMDIPFGLWTKNYLTYKNPVVGFCAPESDLAELNRMARWLSEQRVPLQAFVALTSTRLFNRKATSVSSFDINSLPYPENADLGLTNHEQILVDDIVDYYRDLIRLGEDSTAMQESGVDALPRFNDVYTKRINAIYKEKPLRALEAQTWPGVICQPFVFGEGEVDWEGADELRGKLDKLLQERKESLAITRIARIYDGPCIYLVKPERLRYWLRSVALRDADETLADLWYWGF
uniref:site-specific DNA-methyltransferase (adenine-specific) n=1 Tax=Candidatus Kentrum sp. DK TaxID=2126562 RepID=A0A450TDB0_9GAMM|nr:MAG: N-6 DNA Methylase [Candidatus Kentron sp. DK]